MITCLGLAPAWDVTYGIGALTPGGIHRPTWKTALAGGKALNVARALRTLGVPVRAVAPLGGLTGRAIREALEASGIDTDIVATQTETRMCVSVISDADDRITEFYEQAPPIDDDAWVGVGAAIRRVANGWLAVSGSVPHERIDDLALELASGAQRGLRLAVDLRGEALAAVLAVTMPNVVKVNRSEAEEVAGPAPVAELVRRLREKGAATAVVTDGAEGSIATDNTGTWRAEPFTAGRFTVGAGDSYFAGLLAALDSGCLLPMALKRAASVAAANTLRPGAAVFNPVDAPDDVQVSAGVSWA